MYVPLCLSTSSFLFSLYLVFPPHSVYLFPPHLYLLSPLLSLLLSPPLPFSLFVFLFVSMSFCPCLCVPLSVSLSSFRPPPSFPFSPGFPYFRPYSYSFSSPLFLPTFLYSRSPIPDLFAPSSPPSFLPPLLLSSTLSFLSKFLSLLPYCALFGPLLPLVLLLPPYLRIFASLFMHPVFPCLSRVSFLFLLPPPCLILLMFPRVSPLVSPLLA